MFTTNNTTKHKQLLGPTQYKHFPLKHLEKNANKCCYRLRSCAIQLTICNIIKLEKRQKLGRTTQHSRPMAINTTKAFWHINWIGQHFCLDMSCVQLNCSRESNKGLKEKNPTRQVQDLIKWYQVGDKASAHMWSLGISLSPPPPRPQAPHTHTRSQGLAHSTHRLMAWWCSPDQHDAVRGQEALGGLAAQPQWSEASTQPFLRATTLWPAAELETHAQCTSDSGAECMGRSEGVLERSSSWNILCCIWQLRNRPHSCIKLSMPENQW